MKAAWVELEGDISLHAGTVSSARDGTLYPTSRIPKGLTLTYRGADYTEEGVGFGVPVLKKELGTIFAARVRFSVPADNPAQVVAEYEMGLASSTAIPLLSPASEVMARLHRGYPFLQRPLAAASSLIARHFKAAGYRAGRPRGIILCRYTADVRQRRVHVQVDASGARARGCRELIIMNELGAARFTLYRDSCPREISGDAIESWSPVRASRAGFSDPQTGVSFSLERRPGARLFRGRESAPGRLSWAGFAYVLKPDCADFDYFITF